MSGETSPPQPQSRRHSTTNQSTSGGSLGKTQTIRSYLSTLPLLKHIYGQELSVIPGMDEALALYFLREQYYSGNYDIIVYDGHSSLNTLRMFGLPDTLSWYLRRFQNLLENSDIIKALSPFVQPVSSAILNVTLTPENITPNPSNNLVISWRKENKLSPILPVFVPSW